jgi:hypothetical protein
MITLEDTLIILKTYKDKGYIPTHRVGPTGIGKTLEDILGIEENNIDISNTTFAEIKSARKGSKSMLTLFTKAPKPDEANSKLLNQYGYVTPKSKGKKVLHTTTWATGYNTLRGKVGFKVLVLPNKVSLISSNAEELGYWDELTLRKSFGKKLHHVLYILADQTGQGKTEQFWFNEVWMLTGFNYDGFKTAVNDGVVCVDVRIGQYPNGKPHDHGTGFRVFPDNLGLCFSDRKRLL